MHPMAVRLAGLSPTGTGAMCRVGHPVTTGLPEIDYFLSSDLMEPPDADAHYTEHRVRLPNLSINYSALPDRGDTLEREQLGLRPDATIYLCCQSLFKYLPQYDEVFTTHRSGGADRTVSFYRVSPGIDQPISGTRLTQRLRRRNRCAATPADQTAGASSSFPHRCGPPTCIWTASAGPVATRP